MDLKRLVKLGKTKPGGAALAIVCVIAAVYMYSGGEVTVDDAHDLLDAVEEVVPAAQVAESAVVPASPVLAGTGQGTGEVVP